MTCRYEKAVFSRTPCENCGAPMRRRSGCYGLFYGCTNYPHCTTTRSLQADTAEEFWTDPILGWHYLMLPTSSGGWEYASKNLRLTFVDTEGYRVYWKGLLTVQGLSAAEVDYSLRASKQAVSAMA